MDTGLAIILSFLCAYMGTVALEIALSWLGLFENDE